MKKLMLLAFIVLTSSGCISMFGTSSNIPSTIDTDFTKISNKLTSIKNDIGNKVSSVETDVKVIEKTTTDQSILTNVYNIDTNCKGIRADIKKIEPIKIKLIEAEVKKNEINTFIDGSNELTKENSTLLKENQRLRDSAKKRHERIWMTVLSFCALGLVIGVALLWVNKELGITIVVSSLAIASIAYFMAQYSIYVAWAGGIMFFAALVFLGFRLIKTTKESLAIQEELVVSQEDLIVKERALIDVVTGIELMKRNGKTWDSTVKETNKGIYHANTKKLVQDIITTKIDT